MKIKNKTISNRNNKSRCCGYAAVSVFALFAAAFVPTAASAQQTPASNPSRKVIIDQDLSARSATLGDYALTRLRQLKSPLIKEVRGKGLWLAIELNTPARPLCEALKDRGLLCKETHDTVIRLAPPLIIEKDDLIWALDQIEAVLQSHSA